MAKTLSELLTDTRQIINQPDEANSNFTNTQLTIWLNAADARASLAIRHLPTTQRDYTAASTVTLHAKTLTVDEARLKNPDAANAYYALKVCKIADIIALDPDYENADTGMPTHLAQITKQTAILYPPPKASITALTEPLRCLQLDEPTAMSASGDSPTVPGNLHDILPNYAAHRCFTLLGDTERSTQQLTLFRAGMRDQKALAVEFTKQNKKWKWAPSAY